MRFLPLLTPFLTLPTITQIYMKRSGFFPFFFTPCSISFGFFLRVPVFFPKVTLPPPPVTRSVPPRGVFSTYLLRVSVLLHRQRLVLPGTSFFPQPKTPYSRKLCYSPSQATHRFFFGNPFYRSSTRLPFAFKFFFLERFTSPPFCDLLFLSPRFFSLRGFFPF